MTRAVRERPSAPSTAPSPPVAADPAPPSPFATADLARAAPDARARLIGGLQAGAGNASVSRLLARQQAPAAPPAEQLDKDIADAKGHNDWAKVTELLSHCGEDDLRQRVLATPTEERRLMLAAVAEGNHRVRGRLISAEWFVAVGENRWGDAAVLINGLDDKGIAEHIAGLDYSQLPDLHRGADERMTGVSHDRVAGPALRAYQAKGTADPPGTYVLGVVEMMRRAKGSVEAARGFMSQQLGVAVKPGTGSEDAAEQQGKAVGVLAAAMAAAPKPEPGMLAEGKLAHLLIGNAYAALNPPTLVDPTLIRIVQMLRLGKAALDTLYRKLPEELLESLAVRPDIVDLGKMEIYEIKSLESAPRALPEMLAYIELIESFGIKNLLFSPGKTTNPGANGILPNTGRGTLVWASPWPGGIVYEFIFPMENPRNAQERLRAEAQGAPAVGVETMTAISILAVLGLEELVGVLGAAARQAGQPLPAILRGVNLPPVAAPAPG